MSLELNSTKSTLISPKLFSYGFNSTVEICLNIPLNINSGGLWTEYDDPRWWIRNTLPLLELQLVLYFSLVAIFRSLLQRLKIPKLSVQIMTGLLFGYSWNQWDEAKQKLLFSIQSEEILGMLAYFGYMLFLFISAVKMDVRMIATTKNKALIIGLPTLFVPLIIGILVGTHFKDDGLTDIQKGEVPLIAATYSMISFPVVASLLSDLKIVSSELGRLGLSTALICDLLSQLLITIGNQIRAHRKNEQMGYVSSAVVIAQYLLLCFVFRPAVLWIIKHTPEGKSVSRSRIQGVVFFVILSTAMSNLVPQPAVIGPYVLGLAIPADGGVFSVSLVEKLDSFATDFFLPVFVFASGLHVDLSTVSIAFGASFTRLNMLLVLSTFGAQVVSCFLSSLYCKLPLKQSLALSLMLGCKGATELFFFTLLMEFQHITDGVLAGLVVILLIIATFVPMAVKCLYDPSRKFLSCDSRNRNIMHLYTNSELRILTCLHRNENIFGLLHLLNLSCPTPQNPIAVYVIHLIELVGRTTPIFISHRIKDKAFKDESYSENILHSFDSFQTQHNSTVYVECFTAISPLKSMHSDICNLALDKITSLIILPFHRTWTAGGLVDQDDNTVRAVNCSVIEKAPCSVGIFADKGHLGTNIKMAAAAMATSNDGEMMCRYSVCVIFLGGSDDREAISFSKRLAKDSRIDLMVLKIGSLVEDESRNDHWDKMLDTEALTDFKTNSFGDGRVRYMEEVCEEGPQTALRLREIVKDFDIIIVGRRNGVDSPQTSGLTEWNEFPELGVLGDLIVSIDINNRASVLVIQQKR